MLWSGISIWKDDLTHHRRVATLVEFWVMKYRVYLEPDEDGVFVATCPSLPGCVSQGRTRAEATENIREAIEGYLKSLRKHGDPVPPSILEEVIEVSGG
jgi:predicted RNase H-like HicB family nuclease